MLAKKIKKRDLNAVFCFYILLILVTIIKKKIQCCTFKFNLKSKQNIKHYYSTVSLKFCFMMTNWLHLWKVWTQESSFGGDYFANWLHVPMTKMGFVSLTICDLWLDIFHAVYNKLDPQYNYAHSFDSVLLLSIQDNTPTCNWTLFFPIITNSTKNCLI